MKRHLALLAAIGSAFSAMSADWQLLWDDPNPLGSIRGYSVLHVAVGKSTNAIWTPSKTVSLQLPPGMHQFSVSAVATNDLSSDPVVASWVIPEPVVGVRIQLVVTIPQESK